MSREWKPGDVAVAEIDGQTVRLMRCANVEWVTSDGYARSARDGLHTHTELIDPRPLVVIDPEDREQCRDLADRLAPNMSGNTNATQAALREVARPKPSEPTGLGAVVTDADGCQWVRVWNRHVCGKVWTQGLEIEGQQITRDYADIAAVRVLSEGVTP